MLVQHILNDRLWWFHLWLGEASPETAAFMRWKEEETGEPVHSADELVAGLEATWSMIESALARWTVADLGQVFGEPPASLSESGARGLWPEHAPERSSFMSSGTTSTTAASSLSAWASITCRPSGDRRT